MTGHQDLMPALCTSISSNTCKSKILGGEHTQTQMRDQANFSICGKPQSQRHNIKSGLLFHEPLLKWGCQRLQREAHWVLDKRQWWTWGVAAFCRHLYPESEHPEIWATVVMRPIRSTWCLPCLLSVYIGGRVTSLYCFLCHQSILMLECNTSCWLRCAYLALQRRALGGPNQTPNWKL